VWPRLSSARSPCSVSSAATTRALAAQLVAIASSREHGAPVAFEPGEKVAVADQAVFGHLGVAGAELARAQRVEDAGVGEHQRRLVEGADEILAQRRIDRRLAADAGIDLGEQGRRDLDEAHAAPQRRGAEASEIADDAAAERDDEVAPLDPRLDQRIADPREFGIGLGRLARRADDDRGLQPGGLETVQQRLEMQLGHVGVGDDRAARAGRERRDMSAGGCDQAGTDEDAVGAPAEVDSDLARRRRHGMGKPAAQRADQRLDRHVMRAVARFDRQVGEGVGRAALFEQLAQRRLGVVGAQQRPVRALAHTAQQGLELRLQPHRHAALGDAPARLLVEEGAAAGRQHLGAVVEQTGDHPALAVAKIRLAEPLENLGDRQLGAGLDLVVGVDEGQAELHGEPFADRGLAGPHHADEHDRPAAQGGDQPFGLGNGGGVVHGPLSAPRRLPPREAAP